MEKNNNTQLISKAEMEKIKKEGYRPTVALKTLAQSAKKLNENGLLTDEEMLELKKLHKKALERYMGEDMFK